MTHFVLSSQAAFNTTFDTGRSIWLRDVKVHAITSLAVAGVYYNHTSNFQNLVLIYSDTLGNVLNVVEVTDPLLDSHIAIPKEYGFIIDRRERCVLPFDYLNRGTLGLAIISQNVDPEEKIIREYPVTPGAVASAHKVIEVQNGFMLTGWISKPPQYILDAFVLKTDLDGNMLWMRTYGHPLYEESTRAIVPVDENTVVLGGTRYQRDVFYHGWALAIDSTGNVLWEWEASEEEIPHRRIMDMQYDRENKEWVYLSFLQKPVYIVDLERYFDLSIPVLVRRDSNMQLLYYREYGPYAYPGYFTALAKAHDGGWIAAGSHSCVTEESPYNECYVESGRVIKTSPDGTLEWSVIDTAFYHPELGSRSYLSGVTASPSGSVYASGWAMNYDDTGQYRSFGWLLKITADGCVDTLCTTTSLLEQVDRLSNPVHIYPNPARDFVTVDTGTGMKKAARIHFYDISGRIFSRQEILPGQETIDTRHWPRGVYFWSVVLGDGVVLQTGKLIFQ